MVEQAHLYFRAAVSAAVLNAIAIGGFVLFMALSSVHGWPLRSLVGLADPVGSPPAATNVSRGFGGSDYVGVYGLAAPNSRSTGPSRGGGGAAGVDTNPSGPDRGSGPAAPTPGGQPSGSPSGTPGPVGPDPLGPPGGPIGGAPPDLLAPPALPAPLGPAVQQVGGTISNAPAAVEGTVNNTVGSGGPLGSSATTSGVSGTLQSTSSALVGPSSTVGKTLSDPGGAVQALGATR
jgi:hypothetical protein